MLFLAFWQKSALALNAKHKFNLKAKAYWGHFHSHKELSKD